MDKRIILFELNEVPFRIIDEYCRWHPASSLARRLPECTQHETYTEDRGHLSTWITWPTLHRGVTNERHFIYNFGQDLDEVDDQFPPLWKILAAHGVKTGVCGSLHTYPIPDDLENIAFFLPDTFAAGSECFPSDLSLFQIFNLKMARESARNVTTKVPWIATLQMLRKSSELGFRLRTFLDVGQQLVSEHLRSWQKSRRRTYQAVLAFDIFMKQLQDTRPAFATFFTNHVASSMHRFWAAAFPADYEKFGYGQEWVNTYCHEIEFTMGKFDVFFGRLVEFCDANPEYQLWVVTSMGQAATECVPLETQLYVTDLKKLLSTLGLQESEWMRRPAMVPQSNFVVVPERIGHVCEQLRMLEIDGQPVSYRESDAGFLSVDFGHKNMHDKPAIAKLGDRAVPFTDLGLENVKIEEKTESNAYHIPQGCLVVYEPTEQRKKDRAGQVSTVELAPRILKNFNVPVPAYMRKPAALVVG